MRGWVGVGAHHSLIVSQTCSAPVKRMVLVVRCAWYSAWYTPVKTVARRRWPVGRTTHRGMRAHGIRVAYEWHMPERKMDRERRLTASAVMRSVAIVCAWCSLCMVYTCGEDNEEDGEPHPESEWHEGLLDLGDQAGVHLG